jgi:AAHS family 4-hydroxybenzoate transporter-like MFS transporter
MIFFVSLVGLFFYATWLPTLLHGNGLSGERIVGVTAALQGGGLIGSLILARVMVSVRPFRVITAGFILAAASMLVVSRIGPDYVLLVAMNLLVGILLVGTQNALNASSAQLYPPGIRATGVGWAIGVGRIGGALGPSIAGLLLALHVTPSGLIGLAAMPPLLAAAIAFVISRVVARAPERAGSLAGAAAVR